MRTMRLVLKSLWHRRLTTLLTLCSIGFSVALLVGVERIRNGARSSFSGTISGTDLIVGARGGPIQLMLYTVFRMGNATNNISYEAFEKFSDHPAVAWTIPYSLGDSHRGYRVVATNENFYEHYRYRRDGRVEWQEGQAPKGIFDVALGSDVAAKLDYQVGDKIVLAHGVTSGPSLQNHDDKPFQVVGILKRTATPIDRSLYITLWGMEAIHVDWEDGAPPAYGEEVKAEDIDRAGLKIETVTAFLLRSKNRFEALNLQREVNEYEDEPLMAVIPGVALSELWEGISYAEDGLRAVSFFVVVVGLLGMLISIYNSLNERRREMAILRSLGAGPGMIASLLVNEAVILTFGGIVFGLMIMYALLAVGQPVIENQFGLYIPIQGLSLYEYGYLVVILAMAVVMGLLPAWRAYKNTLQDGLTIRM